MVFLNWQGAALVLARLRHVLVRRADGACWCPALLAFVFGWFAFRSRVTGVYLSIITQAMTYALLLAFFRNDMGFGGNNGLTDFKDILGFNVQADAHARRAVRRLGARAGARRLLVCRRIVALASFGKVLVAVRDAESRTRFLGYRVEHVQALRLHRLGVMAGIAGALYVPQVGIINPGEFAPGQLDRGRDLGRRRRPRHARRADHRRAARQRRQDLASPARFPEFWLFALGALFVVVTLFLPKGIVGTARQCWRAARPAAPRRRGRRHGAAQPAPKSRAPSPEPRR